MCNFLIDRMQKKKMVWNIVDDGREPQAGPISAKRKANNSKLANRCAMVKKKKKVITCSCISGFNYILFRLLMIQFHQQKLLRHPPLAFPKPHPKCTCKVLRMLGNFQNKIEYGMQHTQIKCNCTRNRVRFKMRSVDYISFNGILDNG